MAGRLRVLRAHGVDPGPISTPEEALAQLGSGPDPVPPEEGEWPRHIAGAPERVRTRLAHIAADLTVDELMILTIVHDHAARRRSYELVAQAFEVTPRRSLR